MQFRCEDGDYLIIIPETDADRAQILRDFGPFSEDEQDFGYREPAHGAEFSGKEVRLLPDGTVRIGIDDASWNYDSRVE